MNTRSCRCALFVLIAVAMVACGHSKQTSLHAAVTTANKSSLTDPEKVLNIYNWTDYIAPDILPAFEKEYGIKVNYDFYDSNDVLQTKLLTGHTGYDIVVPTGSFAAVEIKAGVFRKLDKALLPNLKYLDPDLARRMDPLDPGLEHSVNYFWGTDGVGYNVEKIKAAMPDAPVDSCVASATSGQKAKAKMRDFELLRAPRRRSEVNEQTRTSTIYSGTEA